jgi:hypothetical protein
MKTPEDAEDAGAFWEKPLNLCVLGVLCGFHFSNLATRELVIVVAARLRLSVYTFQPCL